MKRATPKYYNRYTFWQQLKYLTHVRYLAGIIITLIIAVVGFIAFDATRSKKIISAEPSQIKTSTYDTNSKLFDTPYFSFEAPKSWQFESAQSGPTHFKYMSHRKNLVEHTFDVYVSSVPEIEIKPSRVIPVTYDTEARTFTQKPVSDHCKAGYPKDTPLEVRIITYKSVAFPCRADSPFYDVVIGLEGGSYKMNLERPNGSKLMYVIYYRDQTALPGPNTVTDLISKFKVK
jgi:hypothetical protein